MFALLLLLLLSNPLYIFISRLDSFVVMLLTLITISGRRGASKSPSHVKVRSMRGFSLV